MHELVLNCAIVPPLAAECSVPISEGENHKIAGAAFWLKYKFNHKKVGQDTFFMFKTFSASYTNRKCSLEYRTWLAPLKIAVLFQICLSYDIARYESHQAKGRTEPF
jgi:hypothetical protein